MIPAKGYAAPNATTPLEPFKFDRREVGPNDVQIEIIYCGVCHSDIHQAAAKRMGRIDFSDGTMDMRLWARSPRWATR